MRVALGQINTTPNDFEGNKEEIFNYISYAAKLDTDLIVFPELSIPGYLCKDLLYRKGFVEKNLAVLADIAAFSREFPHITIVVGYVGKNLSPGKPFTNMAAAIRGGLTLCHYQKQLLPFYDVFDEGRYFEPGTQPAYFEVAGKKCALSICEDVWNDKDQDDYNYATNPVSQLGNIDLLVNISSSPYAYSKPDKRFRMLRKVSEERVFDIVYMNQIGGQDELVFDGRSCIIHRGLVAYEIESTKNSKSVCPIVDIEIGGAQIYSDFSIIRGQNSVEESEVGQKDPTLHQQAEPIKEIYNSLVIGLRDYIKKTGFEQVVLGSSGGIDSAVVASLACDAVGPENVHCIMMPSIYSSDGSLT
jgi:predicted amidohydrolase